jgi:AAA15 family ATPase/GTPase
VADIFMPPNTRYRLPFNSLSHGQKILSILHLLVRVAPANSTIAIDELENFLAPSELQPLYNAFQDAYEERNIQFILISHHPRTLNWYTDSAIVLSFAGNPPTLQARNFIEENEVPQQSLIDFLSESE